MAQGDTLSRYFLYSGVAHVGVLLAFLVNMYVFPQEPLELAAAIRVDMVDLPDKLVDRVPEAPAVKEPAKPVESGEAKKTETAPEKAIVLEKAKKPDPTENLQKKQNDALSKLKQSSALEKIQQELEKEKKKPGAPAPATYKGNQVTTGTELRGLARVQHDQYVGSLERIIRGNWALPEWLANKNLKAQVRVKVNGKGEIIGITLVKPSGNQSFDENVLSAVQKSSPLPAPPERLEILLRNEGILLGFPE